MATPTNIEDAKRRAENSVIAWMITLEAARERGDSARMQQALQQLRRRGVIVKFDRTKREARDA